MFDKLSDFLNLKIVDNAIKYIYAFTLGLLSVINFDNKDAFFATKEVISERLITFMGIFSILSFILLIIAHLYGKEVSKLWDGWELQGNGSIRSYSNVTKQARSLFGATILFLLPYLITNHFNSTNIYETHIVAIATPFIIIFAAIRFYDFMLGDFFEKETDKTCDEIRSMINLIQEKFEAEQTKGIEIIKNHIEKERDNNE